MYINKKNLIQIVSSHFTFDVVPVFWTDYLITAPLYQLAVLLVSLTFDGESPNLTTMRSSL